jgi:hypothetical protein
VVGGEEDAGYRLPSYRILKLQVQVTRYRFQDTGYKLLATGSRKPVTGNPAFFVPTTEFCESFVASHTCT